MVTITFIASDGAHKVEVKPGFSLMEGARLNNVPGIPADCGGACQCGTCHIYVDPDWVGRVGSPSELEQAMLEFAETVQSNSRLACQVEATDALDGLVVRIP
jgi:2Fe-2S ferredoxin